MGKRLLKWIGGLFILFIGLIIAAGAATTFIWPPINDVTTGRTPGYEDLKPQIFKAPPREIFEAAQTALDTIPRMKVIHADEERLRIEAEATTPRGHFTDDMTITIEEVSTGHQVLIRSRSRIGTLDFGQNARNIRELQDAMSREVR